MRRVLAIAIVVAGLLVMVYAYWPRHHQPPDLLDRVPDTSAVQRYRQLAAVVESTHAEFWRVTQSDSANVLDMRLTTLAYLCLEFERWSWLEKMSTAELQQVLPPYAPLLALPPEERQAVIRHNLLNMATLIRIQAGPLVSPSELDEPIPVPPRKTIS